MGVVANTGIGASTQQQHRAGSGDNWASTDHNKNSLSNFSLHKKQNKTNIFSDSSQSSILVSQTQSSQETQVLSQFDNYNLSQRTHYPDSADRENKQQQKAVPSSPSSKNYRDRDPPSNANYIEMNTTEDNSSLPAFTSSSTSMSSTTNQADVRATTLFSSNPASTNSNSLSSNANNANNNTRERSSVSLRAPALVSLAVAVAETSSAPVAALLPPSSGVRVSNSNLPNDRPDVLLAPVDTSFESKTEENSNQTRLSLHNHQETLVPESHSSEFVSGTIVTEKAAVAQPVRQNNNQNEEELKNSLYHQGRHFTDTLVVCLDLAQCDAKTVTIPSTWITKNKNGRLGMPAKTIQINHMVKTVCTLLGKSLQTAIFPTNHSRILSPCKSYERGAFLLRYNTEQVAFALRNELRSRLGDAAVPNYKPVMSRIESSGWPIVYSPDEINKFLQQQIEQLGLHGLFCYHTLSGSYKGTVQFLIPSYLQNQVGPIRTPTGSYPTKWSYLKYKNKKLCTNCFTEDHTAKDCRNDPICHKCGNIWHEDCIAKPTCRWAECPNKAVDHNTFYCKYYMDERDPLKIQHNNKNNNNNTNKNNNNKNNNNNNNNFFNINSNVHFPPPSSSSSSSSTSSSTSTQNRPIQQQQSPWNNFAHNQAQHQDENITHLQERVTKMEAAWKAITIALNTILDKIKTDDEGKELLQSIKYLAIHGLDPATSQAPTSNRAYNNNSTFVTPRKHNKPKPVTTPPTQQRPLVTTTATTAAAAAATATATASLATAVNSTATTTTTASTTTTPVSTSSSSSSKYHTPLTTTANMDWDKDDFTDPNNIEAFFETNIATNANDTNKNKGGDGVSGGITGSSSSSSSSSSSNAKAANASIEILKTTKAVVTPLAPHHTPTNAHNQKQPQNTLKLARNPYAIDTELQDDLIEGFSDESDGHPTSPKSHAPAPSAPPAPKPPTAPTNITKTNITYQASVNVGVPNANHDGSTSSSATGAVSSRSSTPSKQVNPNPYNKNNNNLHNGRSKRKSDKNLQPSSLNFLSNPNNQQTNTPTNKKSKTNNDTYIDENAFRVICNHLWLHITKTVKQTTVTSLKEPLGLGVRRFLTEVGNGNLNCENNEDYLTALCITINKTKPDPVFRAHITPKSLFGTIDISSLTCNLNV